MLFRSGGPRAGSLTFLIVSGLFLQLAIAFYESNAEGRGAFFAEFDRIITEPSPTKILIQSGLLLVAARVGGFIVVRCVRVCDLRSRETIYRSVAYLMGGQLASIGTIVILFSIVPTMYALSRFLGREVIVASCILVVAWPAIALSHSLLKLPNHWLPKLAIVPILVGVSRSEERRVGKEC